MVGEPEKLENGKDASVLIVKRGEKGLVVINLNPSKSAVIETSVSFADGTYVDKANKAKFVVKDGIMKGKVKKEYIAVIY